MILFRLIKDKKVVGYEKHISTKDIIVIAHVKDVNCEPRFIHRIDKSNSIYYIPHDRKDRYTGVKIGEQMLFERDEVEIFSKFLPSEEINRKIKGTIVWNHRQAAWCLEDCNIKSETQITLHNILIVPETLPETTFKITGIEGVEDGV